MVGGGEIEEGYELVEISTIQPPIPPPVILEGMYEVPPPPSSPCHPLSTLLLPLAPDTEEDTLYDVVVGDK